MTPVYHPSEDTLTSFASGALRSGPRLVLETHLAACSSCRATVRICESMGGAMLDNEPPAVMANDLFARLMSRRDASPSPAALKPRTAFHAPAGLESAPASLLRCQIGPWRFVQPGLHISRVRMPTEPDAKVVLLKFGAGRQAPRHGHSGREYTQVITGAFSDSTGSYAAGDCIEADVDIDHQPTVVGDEECICLSAVDGKLKLHSWMARLVQPLLGI